MDEAQVNPNKVGAPADRRGENPEHISVCLCTYQRPKLLTQLLEGLAKQQTGGNFNYSIVVVDNDRDQSAREVVEQFIEKSELPVKYVYEPNKGLSYARNKSVENSSGDYIAIIDDDEVPAEDWLLQLYSTLKKFSADAVFGSVVPRFEIEPPDWVSRRKYFYWRDTRPATGTVADKRVTNNTIVRRDLVVKLNMRFDHDFDFIGGEDEAFFHEFSRRRPGAKFVNCKDAVVYEFNNAVRCDPDYIMKRNLLEGQGLGFFITKLEPGKLRRFFLLTRHFMHSYARVILINMVLPILLVVKKDLGAECLYRNYYHIGVLVGITRFRIYRNRQSIGLK